MPTDFPALCQNLQIYMYKKLNCLSVIYDFESLQILVATAIIMTMKQKNITRVAIILGKLLFNTLKSHKSNVNSKIISQALIKEY